MMLEEYI